MSYKTPLAPVNEKDFPEVTSGGLIWLDQVRVKSIDIKSVNFTFDPASVAASTTVEQTTTLTGLKKEDIVISVIKPTLTTGLAVAQGRVSADNVLSITYINASTSAVDAASETYTLIYIKNSR